jgi:hypothetical protein
MGVREHGVHRIGTTTRRLAILGVVWAAASAVAVAGCSHTTVTSAPSPAGASAPTATATAPPAPTSPGPAMTTPPPGPLTPVRIGIPAIGVDASLVELGLTSDGALAVPTTAMTAGWYTGSPVPGRIGPAVIAGHVHWNGVPGVFAPLADLTPGDRITVTRSDGTTATFIVDRVATYAKTGFPTALVYGSLDFPGLRLITCGGFDPVARAYESNVIVFATLAAP